MSSPTPLKVLHPVRRKEETIKGSARSAFMSGSISSVACLVISFFVERD
jgi:hypothetical protein